MHKNLEKKKYFFVAVLKVTDEKSRILFCESQVRIRGSAAGSVTKFHGSLTQLVTQVCTFPIKTDSAPFMT
jgi:hypothetical protein